ncbi:GlxA family transcriptional regulator [Flavobacterium sp. UMI-01]|uniref:GlxA family transcriptional regulator n=1 Tax=Flavobacterium sp. UMI-01 TaxID=1441053 RepID=UPI001C7D1A5A|nr:helix-turn-helix domain-containing protein [Flavobacterium sp. UMI-01]GIZ07622.1 AraC family transcriptional regulator [Flavobacterium sp. UMI-01]
MKKITVLVPENAVIEAISPAYRLFKTANEFLENSGKKPLFIVEYVGLHNQVITNDGEYIVKTHRLIHEVTQTDVVIIPAIYGAINDAIVANQEAIAWIKKMYANGSEVASLCIGAFLLAETGLVNGKKCSTHWAYYNTFREKYPEVEIVDGAVITDEGTIYSSGGANSLWNLLFYLLEKYADRETAVLASKFFAIDIDRSSQAAFALFVGQKEHDDIEIQKAQEHIEANYHDKMTIDELATIFKIGRRTFERRFKAATNNTIIEYIQRVKVEAAKRSFENSRKNISEVMYAVGYSDTKAFRDLFKKVTGLTPIEYRNKYNKTAIS